MSLAPVAIWGASVPANGEPVPAGDELPASIQITMAAIDPTAEPLSKEGPQLAVLKLIRQKIHNSMDDDSDEESDDEEDSEDEESEEEDAKKKKGSEKKAGKKDSEKMDVDEKDDEENSDDEDDDDDEDDEEMGLEEFIICTLDPTKHYQQPLNITIPENDIAFFRVTGNYTVHLTGNYVVSDHADDDEDSEDDEDYDLSPSEDELDFDSDEESDDLDDLADPRITEIDSEEEEKEKEKAKPKKEKKEEPKKEKASPVAGKKRPAEDEEKKDEPKLSKKQQKKLKANDGKAAEAPATSPGKDAKKVKFAAQLEQGPTPSKEQPKASNVKKVNGITIEDVKVGSGPAAKKGSKLKMRYIGKLKNGNKFDSNTSGKPFSFTLGRGEVIKGWDIGLLGIQAGGERRLVIPAESAYGSQKMPGIPPNSTLIFEVKAVAVN